MSSIAFLTIQIAPSRTNDLVDWYALKSLRKIRQKCGGFPSRELIIRCSGWISLIQRLRTLDFRSFAPLGLPDRCSMARSWPELSPGLSDHGDLQAIGRSALPGGLQPCTNCSLLATTTQRCLAGSHQGRHILRTPRSEAGNDFGCVAGTSAPAFCILLLYGLKVKAKPLEGMSRKVKTNIFKD